MKALGETLSRSRSFSLSRDPNAKLNLRVARLMFEVAEFALPMLLFLPADVAIDIGDSDTGILRGLFVAEESFTPPDFSLPFIRFGGTVEEVWPLLKPVLVL